MGLLTDKSGNKLEDLSDIKWAEPLEKSIDRVIHKMDELIDKIGNGLGGAFRSLPTSIDAPDISTRGGSSSLALQQPSASNVLPFRPASIAASSQPIVTKVYIDGREVAEATVPYIPGVLARRL